MFKIISLSSPTELFSEIVFKDGLNIILGNYSKSGKDINGIGKTTIINFIDYCFLANGPKSLLFSEKYSFLKNEKISLKFSIGENEYSIERDFQNKNQAILTRNSGHKESYTDTDLRLILGAEMGKGSNYEGIYDPLWFRTLMSFFIQNDHSFLSRDSKNVLSFTSNKRQAELMTYCLLLLGIDNTLIWNFDQDKIDLKKLQSDQTRINKQITEQTGRSVDDFKAECDSVNRKVEKLEEGLDNYTFDENQTDLEEKINALNTEISALSKEHMKSSKKLQDIQESLKISIDIDVEKISDLYFDLNQEFSNFIKKGLEEVIAFRQQISTNRSKFLKERERDYSEKLKNIREKIVILEVDRSDIYKMLDEKSAFDSIKSAYTNLLDEKSRLAGKQSYIEQLDYIENSIATKKSCVGNIVADIVKNKESSSIRIEEAKNIFLDIVENSVDTDHSDVSPYYDIKYKSNQISPMQIKLEVPRGGSLGKGRFKILAFDLTMFITSGLSNSNLPCFLIHDGVFHGIAHKTRINFLNYINKKLNEIGNLQYIITVNEDEVIFPENEDISAQLDFDLSEKSLVILEDNPENMFLGKEFG